MTPQERQLITELFDRLAKLEDQPRDSDAERAIAEGFDRAPNAAYPLVQTVLVQDEALKRANARIEELQAALGHEAQPAQPTSGSFLDTMRNAIAGREAPRSSVPSVHGGMGTSGVWNTGARPVPGWSAPPADPPAAPPAYGGGGSSFLGTAAASAAGMIGGAMLFNGIRSMFGPSYMSGASAFNPGPSGGGSPWGGNASGSDLARDAGLNDIGSGNTASFEDGSQRAGLLDSDADAGNDGSDNEVDSDVGGGFDGGDTDTV